jgi:hypothetical protein
MIVQNKLNKSFGPVGSFSGIIVFVLGLISTYYSLYMLGLVLIGAFVGFTSSSTFIDFEQKRVKFSNTIFGIIRTGKWMAIETDMKIGLNISNQVWNAYSQSNRGLDIDEDNILIILYSSNKQKIMPLKKLKTLDNAKEEILKLRNGLGIN